MLINVPYNRYETLEYAARWAYRRNPEYYDFSNLGGDCTNFVSQCIYAGAKVMNYTRDLGWYYISPDNRAPAWTGVQFLSNFLLSNKSAGPYAREVDAQEIEIGDVIQLGDENGRFYHSLIVVATRGIPSPRSIYIATHSDDAFLRRLSTYDYYQARFLHIEGVRKWVE